MNMFVLYYSKLVWDCFCFFHSFSFVIFLDGNVDVLDQASRFSFGPKANFIVQLVKH